MPKNKKQEVVVEEPVVVATPTKEKPVVKKDD